jgi:hypothetical protein
MHYLSSNGQKDFRDIGAVEKCTLIWRFEGYDSRTFYNDVGPALEHKLMAEIDLEDPETKEKYILVVVDMATKQTDAIGLKDKTADAVITGFKKIFKGKVLNEPRYLIQFDNGGEFTAQKTKDYFTGLGVELRFGKPYRSRMQALAEAKNKIIGKALFMRMTANELETGEQDTEWSQFLKPLLTELNKHIKETNKAKEAKEKKLEEKKYQDNHLKELERKRFQEAKARLRDFVISYSSDISAVNEDLLAE